MRRVLLALLRVLGGVLLTLLSLVLHLGTANGRAAVRDLVTQVLPGVVPGNLEIGRVRALSPSLLALDGVSWSDDARHEVVRDATVEVSPAWRLVSAPLGRGPWPKVLVRARRVWARVPTLGPERVVTGAQAPAPLAPLNLVLPRVELDIERLDNALGGPEVTVRDLRGDVSLAFAQDRPEITLRLLRAGISLGPLSPVTLDAAAQVASERDVTGRVDLQGAPLQCEIRATSASRDVTVDLRRCAVSSELISFFAGTTAPAVRIDQARLVRGRDDALTLTASLRVEGDAFGLRASLRGDELAATLSPRHASLRWAASDLPPIDLDGDVTASAVRRGDAWTFRASTLGLRGRVAGFLVPGAQATARLDGTQLVVDSLTSPSLHLDAHGSLDTEHPESSAVFDARARGLSLGALEIPGAAMSGVVDLDLALRGQSQGLRSTLTARVQRFAGFGARASSARVNATMTAREGVNALTARAAVTGLQVADHGPFDGTIEVEGDVPRSLTFRADASGDLPPAARGPLHARAFTAQVEGRVSRSGARTEVRVGRLEARAGGLSLGATGLTRLLTTAAGTSPEAIETTLSLPGEGHVQARLRGQRLELQLRGVRLREFASIAPALAPLGGVLGGTATLDLRSPGRSSASLELRSLDAPFLGVMSPTLVVTPMPDGFSAIRLALRRAGRGDEESELEVRVPRRLGDVTAWIDGVRRGEINLPTLDLALLRDRLPRGLRSHGTAGGRVTLSRATPQVLDVEVTAEARQVVLSVGVLRFERELIVPLRARVSACAHLDPRRDFNDPLAVRLAVGAESENTEAAPRFGCAAESTALPTTLLDVAAGVDGPWRRSARSLTLTALRAPPAALLRQLAEVPLRGHVAVGPITRARWPLRRGRVPGLPASLRGVLEPDLDPAARAGVTVDLGGTLASPTLRARAEASAPLLTQAGITAPLHASLQVDVETSGASIATPLRFTANVEGGLSDGASNARRGTLTALARVSAPISQLLDDARGAAIETLRLNLRNVRLEQFSDLASRGVQGGVDVDFARTETPARPFTARVALRDVRTVPPGLERIVAAIPPVNATLIGYVDEGAAGAEAAHLCVVAGAGNAVTDCAPQPVTAEGAVNPGLLRADAEIPFPRGLAHGPDLANLAVSLRALDFRVDGLGALAPASTVTDLGGVMSATMRWRARDPIRPVGQFALSHGRATLATLGEPVDDLNVELSIEGRRAHIERFEGRLGVGTIQVTGDALVGRGGEIARVALEAITHELPAVSNGHTWAWVTGAIGTELVARRSGVQVSVRVHEARVRVQDEPARALINMSPDPAVFVRGRTRLSRTVAADTIPIDLAFTLETPMWLRRSDFVVAINGHGNVHMDRAGAAVAATFESARVPSWVSFYGKRFDLERANITLDGSVNVNPQLDLVARHDGGAIGDVVLALEGRLYDPRISLTAASQPDLGMAEVLSMLILGRRDNGPTSGQTDLATQAGDMARSLVTGLTLGFITSTLRAQFAFLPTLIAEPGTSDAGRYGAGFNLGPRVYLQATYGTASSAVGLGTSGGSGAQEFRVLLEYAMTSSLSSSLTYGTWPQFGTWQNNWGFDVFWSP